MGGVVAAAQTQHLKKVQTRAKFVVYGTAGWLIEVVMTGVHSLLIGRDRCAPAKTSLWMHPIYGLGGLLLEQTWTKVQRAPRWLRYLHYLPLIYGVEYSTGWLMRRMLGRCPWDYTSARLHLSGLVRLDYAPLWLLVGVLFEKLREQLEPQPPAEPDAALALAHAAATA
jgi:uncharacterized membrane protein